MEINSNYVLYAGIALFVLMFVLTMLRGNDTKEGYAYEYPYSFFQCARRACPFEYREMQYLTDQDAFVKVY